MNPVPPPDDFNLTDDREFSFFPESRRIVQEGEGREHHEVVKTDLVSRREPTERQIGITLFLAALALYLVTLSWAPFPGLPSYLLRLHLDLDIKPADLDLLWGWLVRLFTRLPGLTTAGWTSLFSAVCGAASVSLLGRLMSRVGYFIRNEPGPLSFSREAQARRLSGWVSGIYLACCIPFWMSATRSLPGTFHLFLLLQTAWYFSEYQHWGQLRHLSLVTLLYGIGITEFATFIVYLPVAVFLVAREMFRWHALRTWRGQLLAWGGLLLGLALYPLQAWLLFRRGFESGVIASPLDAWLQIVQHQLALITDVRFNPGFPVIMFFALIPWVTLFAMSSRSPWFYESWQVAVRLIFITGLLGVVYNATFSPWNLLGMDYLMLTPYALLGAAMGYMAGEFWILGEVQRLLDISWMARGRRHLASAFALLLPVGILVGGITSWSKADGRPGRLLDDAAREILSRLEGRDILFTVGILDDALSLAAREQHLPVHLISIGRASSPLYLRKLAGGFADEEMKPALQNGHFGDFLDILLLSEAGVARTSIIDMPDLFREFGYLVPDGLVYRLDSAPDRTDLAALARKQQPFWNRLADMARNPAPEKNLVRPYQDLLLLLASKTANNLGVQLAEHGNFAAALETFRAARRIHPDNLSAGLNLLTLARTRPVPEVGKMVADWKRRQVQLSAGRWALSARYGYVWRAYDWAARGYAWVLSGTPTTIAAARRNPTPASADAEVLAQWLDQVYLVWGVSFGEEITFRDRLMQDGRDTEALMGLCRLALRRNDLAAAKAYLAEANAMGLPEEQTRFDQAMIAYVDGNTPQALEMLTQLTRQTPNDLRVWVALAKLGDPADALNAQAMKILRRMGQTDLGTHLAIASLYLARRQWDDARRELDKVLQLDASCAEAWEMMVTAAQELGNRALLQTSMNALLAQAPDHFIFYQNEGVRQYQRGNLEKAEAAFRKGIEQRRDPALLNNLAYVILEQKGNLTEALQLVEEAMKRRPGLTDLYGTRAEIHLNLGHFTAARDDLQYFLKKRGRNHPMLLLLALSYEGLGDRERALTVARALAREPDKLTAEQKEKLRGLIIRLRQSKLH